MKFSLCTVHLRRKKSVHIGFSYLLCFALYLLSACTPVAHNVHEMVLVLES